MRVERLTLGDDPYALAAEVRALAPPPPYVEAEVAEILARVRDEGDAAVLEYTRRFDTAGAEPAGLRVPNKDVDAARAAVPPDVRAALQLARENVNWVSQAGVDDDPIAVDLPQGHRITLRDVPVESVAVYVPGGRAPYLSTVVMGATAAQAAGVGRVSVCAPPRADGAPHAAILAACHICDVDDVYCIGGAQAIGALAYGTKSVVPVDLIVGPGNPYVTEAKRQVFGHVGIDSLAGPSELLIVIEDGDERTVALVALDLLAQAEHGEGSLVAVVSPSSAKVDALAARLERLAAERPTVAEVPCVLVEAGDLTSSLTFARILAPEHLQVIGEEAEAIAWRYRFGGCVFLGADAGTAFGDYVAGSNHILPTGGAARFASGLGPATFRRRVAEVRLDGAAAALAPPGAAIARAEGFEVHARSMEARMGENRAP